MKKEVLKCINDFYQKMKIEINRSINALEIGEKNVERYEIKMWNLEDKYSCLKRKKFLNKIKYYMLNISTIGVYGLISKKNYEANIDDIDEQIIRTIFDTSNLKRLIKENEELLSSADEISDDKKVQFNNLAMFFDLIDLSSDEEINKYLGYKMGDNNGNNKNN